MTDQIKNGNIEIVHCPTKQMIVDYFTKALQGALFHLFRRVIMGWDHISTVFDKDDVSQERVGNMRDVRNNANTSSKAKKVTLTYKEAVLKQNAVVGKIAHTLCSLN